MPFDIVAYGEATPGTGDPAALAVCLKDSHYRVSGDDLFIKKQAPWLLGLGSYIEAQGARTVLSQPSLAQNYEFLRGALLSSDSPSSAWTHLFGRPLPLIPGEKLNCGVEMIADEDAIVFMALGSSKITQAMVDAVNPTHVITGEANDTLTAFTWTGLTVTWDQDLPRGRYAVVGMIFSYFKSSVAMPAAARLLFHEKEAAGWRPGVVGVECQADHEELQTLDHFPAVDWPLMPECVFEHDQMPGIEACGAEATTDENFQLLLQKL